LRSDWESGLAALVGCLKTLFNFKTVGSRTDSRLPFFSVKKGSKKTFLYFLLPVMGSFSNRIA
jgi:hypothetical protein